MHYEGKSLKITIRTFVLFDPQKHCNLMVFLILFWCQNEAFCRGEIAVSFEECHVNARIKLQPLGAGCPGACPSPAWVVSGRKHWFIGATPPLQVSQHGVECSDGFPLKFPNQRSCKSVTLLPSTSQQSPESDVNPPLWPKNVSHEKYLGWLGYIGDYTSLPNYK